MTLGVRLAVLRAHHDAAYAALSDQACSEMLVENPRGTAVLTEYGDPYDIMSSASFGRCVPRIWYRGRILVPLTADSDMHVQTTPLSVRAVATGDDWVDLEVVHGTERGITLSVTRQDVIASDTQTGVENTPCGDSRIDVNITQATQELAVTSTRGHRYNVEIIASVTEPGGTAHTATAAFDPTGSYVGIAPEDQGVLDECWQKWAKSKRLEPFQRLRARDLFRRTPEGRRVLVDEPVASVLADVLGQHRFDRLEPAGREALQRLIELGLR